jgi:hypothetical protein
MHIQGGWAEEVMVGKSGMSRRAVVVGSGEYAAVQLYDVDGVPYVTKRHKDTGRRWYDQYLIMNEVTCLAIAQALVQRGLLTQVPFFVRHGVWAGDLDMGRSGSKPPLDAVEAFCAEEARMVSKRISRTRVERDTCAEAMGMRTVNQTHASFCPWGGEEEEEEAGPHLSLGTSVHVADRMSNTELMMAEHMMNVHVHNVTLMDYVGTRTWEVERGAVTWTPMDDAMTLFQAIVALATWNVGSGLFHGDPKPDNWVLRPCGAVGKAACTMVYDVHVGLGEDGRKGTRWVARPRFTPVLVDFGLAGRVKQFDSKLHPSHASYCRAWDDVSALLMYRVQFHPSRVAREMLASYRRFCGLGRDPDPCSPEREEEERALLPKRHRRFRHSIPMERMVWRRDAHRAGCTALAWLKHVFPHVSWFSDVWTGDVERSPVEERGCNEGTYVYHHISEEALSGMNEEVRRLRREDDIAGGAFIDPASPDMTEWVWECNVFADTHGIHRPRPHVWHATDAYVGAVHRFHKKTLDTEDNDHVKRHSLTPASFMDVRAWCSGARSVDALREQAKRWEARHTHTVCRVWLMRTLEEVVACAQGHKYDAWVAAQVQSARSMYRELPELATWAQWERVYTQLDDLAQRVRAYVST